MPLHTSFFGSFIRVAVPNRKFGSLAKGYCPRVPRQRSCQKQGIGDRNNNQYAEMEQTHFHSKIGVLCKSAERVDGGVDENAGNQASAAIIYRDQQEADCDCKNDLAQVVDNIHAAAVKEVDDMPDAEGHTGDNNGGFCIIPCDCFKQKPPEDHFLQESDAEHTYDSADRFRRRIVDRDAVPKVPRCQDSKRHIEQEPSGGNGRFAKPIPLVQVVSSDKGKKGNGLQDAKHGACGVFRTDHFVERICERLQDAVNYDPHNRKGQFVFLV